MSAFVIPSIFTAIDKMTAPLKRMKAGMAGFAQHANGTIARQERLFNKLTPSISEAQKQMLSMIGTAAMAAGIIGGITFSAKTLIDYEKAVASFRTIVGGTDAEFSKYQAKINEVARDTKKSAIDTAAAFEKIAGLNAKFAETAEGIGQVSRAAIILSKASGEELGTSAESLVGIMNQFSFAANQADRTINVLAAGAGVGAASIAQTSEAFVNFGSVAAGANISLEQSVGLVQTLGKFSVFGAEAGTKLRGSILKLQQAGIGYKTGQFQINDALQEAASRIAKLKTAKEKDAAILKMFGAENIATGRILLSNIETFKEFTKQVTGTSEAQKAAETRSNTLANRLDELKNTFINMLVGSDKAKGGLEIATKAVQFLSDNMSDIVKWGKRIIYTLAAWKALLISSKIVMTAFNIVVGIQSVVTGASSLALKGNTVALGAQAVAMRASAAATWLFNTALFANPIAWVVAGVLALVAALGYVIANYRSIENLHNESKDKNRAQAMSQEAQQVQKLAERYKQMGMSASEANKRALEVSKTMLKADLADVKVQYIAAKTDSQKRIAEKRFSSLEGRAKGIADFESNQTLAGPISNKTTFQQALIENKTSAEASIRIYAPEGYRTETESKDSNVNFDIMPKLGSTGGWGK